MGEGDGDEANDGFNEDITSRSATASPTTLSKKGYKNLFIATNILQIGAIIIC